MFSRVSQFVHFPETPADDIFIEFLDFGILASKTRKQIAKHGGQIVWPGFPPHVLAAFRAFFAPKLPLLSRPCVGPKSYFLLETPYFLVFRLRKPFCNQISREKRGTKFPSRAGDQIPLLQAPKKGASQSKTVQRRRTTVRQLKHMNKNNTKKTLEAEEEIAEA